jgi:hypothetical protein
MKKLIETDEEEGLDKLMGQNVMLFCLNYIYAGKLVGVNKSCVLLDSALIVYETGELSDKQWKDAQKLPGPLYVQLSCIESFGPSGRV